MSVFADGIHALREMPIADLAPLVGIPAYWILGLGVFLIGCAIRGVPHSERIQRARLKVLPPILAEYAYWQFRIPVTICLKLGITADMVTILSLVTAVGSGAAFAVGRFSLGGWVLALSGACDALDGVVARESGTSSERGEFFDAFIDRYADFFVSFGLLYYYRNDLLPAALVVLLIIGSQAMGYAKAKGEAVGVDPKVGLMQRGERCFYLLAGATLSPIAAAFIEPGATHPMFHLTIGAVALIAVLTNFTAIWRAAYVMRRMKRPASPPVSPALAAGERVPLPSELLDRSERTA